MEGVVAGLEVAEVEVTLRGCPSLSRSAAPSFFGYFFSLWNPLFVAEADRSTR